MAEQGAAFIVGPGYRHHAGHSGYQRFAQGCATFVRPPVSQRFLSGRLGTSERFGDHGWRVDQAVTALVPRPLYSLGILATELHTGAHMARRRGCVYHAIYGETDVWLLPRFARRTGNRIVASFHEPPESLAWLEVDRIAPRLDAVVLVSESQRPYFQPSVPEERIFVVPHGVDTAFFHGDPQARPTPMCITVGSHLRDFETLVAVIDKVRAERPDVVFVGVGTRQPGGGNSQLHDERVISLSGISDEELRALYRAARVAVFSMYEATANNALLEALASGVPVVATDVGGVAAATGRSAHLVPPYDADAMAGHVLRLLRDDDEATALGTAGAAQAQQFDFGEVSALMAEVYARVLALPPRR